MTKDLARLLRNSQDPRDFESCDPSALTDMIFLMCIEAQTDQGKMTRLKTLTRQLLDHNVLKLTMLLERLDAEFLESIQLIPSAALFSKKIVKKNTNILYRQQKFNLLREESEGYSKLLIELNSLVNAKEPSSEKLLNLVFALIGTFELDPNRVLDVILDFMALNTSKATFFVDFLKKSPWKPIVNSDKILVPNPICGQIIGFKFQSSVAKTRIGMYEMCAILIKEKLLNLGDLFNHLTAVADWDTYIQEIQKKTSQAGRFNSFGLVGSLESTDSNNVTQEPEVTKDRSIELDQRAGIATCLLNLGQLEEALLLIQDLRLVNMYPELAVAASKVFEKLITSNNDQFKQCCSKMLPLVGPHLHRNISLLVKIVRGAIQHLKSSDYVAQDDQLEPLQKFYLNIVLRYLFPALSQLDANAFVVNEVFQLVKLFSYQHRFVLYKQWKQLVYQEIPELKIAKQACIKDMRYIMRRLSKETVRQYGRHIGKVVRSNPTIAFGLIIDQLQSYDNQIPHVVEASRYMTDFEFDAFSWALVEALGSFKERVQPSGTLVAKWLTNLATLVGNLSQRHSGIEVEALIQYVAEQLMKGNIYDLVVLQELVDQMSGIKVLDDVTSSQLEAFAGGETLLREALMYENTKAIRKSSSRLARCLLDSGLASKLTILLAQITRDIIHLDEDAQDLKILGWRFDHCLKTWIQFTQFLVENVDRDSYCLLWPDLQSMLHEYGLDPCFAFHILRPKLARQATINTTAMQNGSTSGLVQTFWQHCLYDIYLPIGKYESEIAKLKESITKIERQIQLETSSNASKLVKEKDRIVAVLDSLDKEFSNQRLHVTQVNERLEQDKNTWFSTTEYHSEVFKTLVLPRCIFTPQDAVYSAKFIFKISELKPENWLVLPLFNVVFNEFPSVLPTFTEVESKNFGVWMQYILEQLNSLLSNGDLFNSTGIFGELEHANYQTIVYDWHCKLHSVLVKNLESGEYIRIRNSVIVLDRIRDYFPIVNKHGESIATLIKSIEETESRSDLKQLARSFYAKFYSLQQNWISAKKMAPLLDISETPEPQPDVITEPTVEMMQVDEPVKEAVEEPAEPVKEASEDKNEEGEVLEEALRKKVLESRKTARTESPKAPPTKEAVEKPAPTERRREKRRDTRRDEPRRDDRDRRDEPRRDDRRDDSRRDSRRDDSRRDEPRRDDRRDDSRRDPRRDDRRDDLRRDDRRDSRSDKRQSRASRSISRERRDDQQSKRRRYQDEPRRRDDYQRRNY